MASLSSTRIVLDKRSARVSQNIFFSPSL